MKGHKIQITENQIFATHNLEVPGSSPGWSTPRIRLQLIEVATFIFYVWHTNYESVALISIPDIAAPPPPHYHGTIRPV